MFNKYTFPVKAWMHYPFSILFSSFLQWSLSMMIEKDSVFLNLLRKSLWSFASFFNDHWKSLKTIHGESMEFFDDLKIVCANSTIKRSSKKEKKMNLKTRIKIYFQYQHTLTRKVYEKNVIKLEELQLIPVICTKRKVTWSVFKWTTCYSSI